MVSSADQSGSDAERPSSAEGAPADTQESGAARAESGSAADAARADAAQGSSGRADDVKEASDIVVEKKAPGSALITVIPAADRFDGSEGGRGRTGSGRLKQRLFFYASRAAVIIVLLGAGYVTAAHFFQGETSPAPAAKPRQLAEVPAPITASATSDAAERAELRRITQQMAEEIRSLKASLASLHAGAPQAQGGEEVHALKKSLDGLKSSFEANKTEINVAIAQLAAKIDRLQREQTAKLQQTQERLPQERLPSSSLQANAAAQPRVQSQAPLPPAEAQKKASQPVADWVVRDVYDGIALVEGPGGAFEVMPGENIPGVGTVKSIERRGRGWIVVTNHGLVETARD